MVGLVLSLLAFGGAVALTCRRLSDGLGLVLSCGYFYGILRANFLDGLSHFIFDSALLGLYLGHFVLRRRAPLRRERHVRTWFQLLFIWPLVMLLVSPLLDSQHVFIQLVGLRAAIFMLPVLLIGTRLEEAELDHLTSWVLVLNLVAFAVAVAEVVLGIEPFFPLNPVTELMYNAGDVGPEGHYRIPSVFSNAHSYGGTMAATVPLLLHRLTRSRGRLLVLTGLVATVVGCFICAARIPVIVLAVVAAVLLLTTRPTPRTLLATAFVGAVVGFSVASTERLQRFLTLNDTSYVEERVGGSVNVGLLDILLEYPVGAGLGAASGTSVPYFLSGYLRPQVGLESELSRIQLEQGVVGLLFWILFIGWTLLRFPSAEGRAGISPRRAMWALVLVEWATAFVGTGMLTSIPHTPLLLLMMGVLGQDRAGEVRKPARSSALEFVRT
ncbi:MAG: hypothetical protein L0Y66_20050 [Myxococcaceae bacterium]|nr:hypothetical protein [Myxococcaceae bacterium]